ncbi:MAG: glycosyltransferase [Candidatus Helarchaeota archaeon]|nr:glycosyltransferase [Candidatus Helarchaeota archaeon]
MVNQKKIKVLLIDEGLNTGTSQASKIGGSQLNRWRLFSQNDIFEVTVLTSEPEIAALWRESALVVFNPKLNCYRPSRSQLRFKLKDICKLLRESIRVAKIMNSELRSLDYEIILLNDNKSRLLYIISSIIGTYRLPAAVRAIEMDTEWNISPYDGLIKIIYLIFFDKILLSSFAVKKKLSFWGKLFKKKLQVAYPLGDTLSLLWENTRYKIEKKKLVFANIGTVWFRVKGQDIIVEAIEKLVKGRNDVPVEVRFFGDGPNLENLNSMIKEKNLQNYLKVRGYEKDHYKIFNDIHCCIVASRTEAGSGVLIECLQRNIPAIVSDIDSNIELNNLYYNGLSFRSEDSDDLAALLNKLIDGNILTELHEILKNSDKKEIAYETQKAIISDFLRDF